jgi:SM-20-related protein
MSARTLPPEFLTRLGIFVEPEFLDRDTCQRLSDEMVTGPGAPARVTVDDAEDKLDQAVRRTTIAEVSSATVELVEERLLREASAVERHFSVELDGCERPQFLLYREGDFIGRHSDGAQEAGAPALFRRRAVSAVVFLNDQRDDAGGAGAFTGGGLTFYGLLGDDPRGKAIGLPIQGVAGMLVAFTTDLVHAVTPVISGARCTAVSWYMARPDDG